MTEKIHSKETSRNNKQQAKAELESARSQPSDGLGLILLSAGLLAGARDDRSALQAKNLHDQRLKLVQRQSLARSIGQKQGNQHLSRSLRIQRGKGGEKGEGEQTEKRYNITLSTGTRDNLTEGEAIAALNESYDSMQRNLELYEGEHKMIKQNRDTDAFIGVGGFLTDLFGEDFPDVAMWDEPRMHLARARTALWTKNIEGAGNELAAANSSFQKCKEKWLSYKEQLPNAGTKAQVGVVVIAVLAVVVIVATGGTAGAGAAAAGEGGTAAGGAAAAGGTAAEGGAAAAGGVAAGGEAAAAGGAAAGGTAAGGTAAGGGAAAAGGVVVGGGVTTAATAATTLPGVSLVNMLITEVGGALASGNAARALTVLGAYASTPGGRQALLKCGQVVIAHMQQPGLTQEEFQMLKQIADSFFQFARGG